jgi:hypothetical protein
MNYKNIFLGCMLAIAISSCNDLNVPPINIVQDKDIFQSESGITSYMARLYTELPIEDFNFNRDFNQFADYPTLGNSTGEMLMCMADMVWDSPSGDWFGAWKYGSIRNVNYFINEFPNYSSTFTVEKGNAWLGEAYFIRAYCYFAMVKRYGGVPIIKTVQNYPEQSLEELKVTRNTEQEVYDFVAEDLDKAIELLPETALAKGRASKNIARALKSRAMLYAGSIAQYGQMQLNNLLGIPSSDAKRYYQAAYEAAKSLEGKYSLYNKYADKFENYWKLFLDDDSPENIFCKYYKYPEATHSYDALHIPFQMRGAQGYSSRFCPTLDFVEMFDDINGKSNWLDVGTDANPTRYNDRMDIFKNIEPRLRGSVILPGDVFKNEVIDVQKGIYTSYPSGDLMTSSDFNTMYKDKSVIGKSGMGNNETTSTGFFVRKYQNPNITKAQVVLWQSTQHWIDIRYAEILLNRAEAAFQLGMIDDALYCINLIRERAGAKLYTKDQLTIKAIQKERRMELAFENHTYWDLRRWRIADSEINNRQFKALCPYYIYDEGKYIYKKEFVGPKYTFDVKVNYVKIPTGEISKNEKLIQNPGY